MGRSKELLEQLEQMTEERDIAYGMIERQRGYVKDLRESNNKLAVKATSFMNQKMEAEASADVWRSRWQSLDNDFQDLVDDFHTSENEVIKLSIEIESLKGN